MKRVVLDASALMVFFEERPGAPRVEELLRRAGDGDIELSMSVVNWGEVYYSRWKTNGWEAGERAIANIAQLPITIVEADVELTKLAASLRAQGKLPYADCFAAALALLRKAAVATADRDFSRMASELKIVWTTGG